jgi:hypothetical protein
MQGARLGLLDLGKFKRHVNYCLLPNGTCTDLTLEAGGRYEDLKPNDYMARMGIWVENFALPAVINECLLQSYTGELRFFPNWSTADGEAQFKTLRAVGAFLVSSQFRGGKTQWIHVTSEAGGLLKIHNPWQGEASIRQRGKKVRIKGAHWEISTHAGETILITEAGT